MNYKWILWLLCLAIGGSISYAQQNSLSKNWQIDKELKFNYAYFRSHSFRHRHHKWSQTKALNFVGKNKPDISNISLIGLLTLGFPLSVSKNINVARSTFYLKFYSYPKDFNAKRSFEKIRHMFLLDDFTSFNSVAHYAQDVSHNVVKLGFIASTQRDFSNTYPAPLFKRISQRYFDHHIPFVSLYVLPLKKQLKKFHKTHGQISWNITGVLNLHKQLMQYYSDHYKLIHSDKDNNYFVYQKASRVTLITIPKSVKIFDKKTWKNLPMPQASNLYLSSLLLIYSTQYKIHPKQKVSYDMLLRMHAKSRMVFEIPSIYRS